MRRLHCSTSHRRCGEARSEGCALLPVALDVEAAAQVELVTAGLAEVVGDHFADQVAEPDSRRPAQALARLGGVADEALDLGGPVVPGIDPDQGHARLHRLALCG